MTELVAIIDYGSGNLKSAHNAFSHVARASGIDADIVVTDDPAIIHRAGRVVLPGQGAFGDCMAGLSARPGLLPALRETVERNGTPFLGICVGMQLMAAEGFEHGRHGGLGWVEGIVRKMTPSDAGLKIPHMGWNSLSYANGQPQQTHPVLQHVLLQDHFYFVHSFVFESKDSACIVARADYGGDVPAIIARNNMIGVQFHPEKSQDAGLRLLRGFLAWRPQGIRTQTATDVL